MNASLPAKLLPVERAQAILAECTKVDEVKKVLDQAAAIRLYFRRQKAALESQNHATEIMIWSQRRLGELTASIAKLPPGRTAKALPPKRGGKTSTLGEQGISQQEASRWKKLADVPVKQLREHIEQTKQRTEKLSVSGAIAAVSHGADYTSDEWYTPDDWLEAAREVLGGIDLDPASSATAQRRVKARAFCTEKDSGLARPWKGRVFLNPPYSQPLCAEFVAKFIAEATSGRMAAGLLLLNASTDTRWFHDLASRFPACFTSGRIAFLQRNGKAIAGNRVGQVVFYHGKARAKFVAVFSKLGTVMEVCA